MQIWIDADACPNAIKEIIYRAAMKRKVAATLVANTPLRTPPSPHINTVVVDKGIDVADAEIVARMDKGDLVVTADIPLASHVVKKGGYALNPRGEVYDEVNIGERLSMRNFMDELRSGGFETGGPAALGPKDRQAFANSLDRLLTKALNLKKAVEPQRHRGH